MILSGGRGGGGGAGQLCWLLPVAGFLQSFGGECSRLKTPSPEEGLNLSIDS